MAAREAVLRQRVADMEAMAAVTGDRHSVLLAEQELAAFSTPDGQRAYQMYAQLKQELREATSEQGTQDARAWALKVDCLSQATLAFKSCTSAEAQQAASQLLSVLQGSAVGLAWLRRLEEPDGTTGAPAVVLELAKLFKGTVFTDNASGVLASLLGPSTQVFANVLPRVLQAIDDSGVWAERSVLQRLQLAVMCTDLADKTLPVHADRPGANHEDGVTTCAVFGVMLWGYDHAFDTFPSQFAGRTMTREYLEALNQAALEAFDHALAGGASFFELAVRPPVGHDPDPKAAALQVALMRSLPHSLWLMGRLACHAVTDTAALRPFRDAVVSHLWVRQAEMAELRTRLDNTAAVAGKQPQTPRRAAIKAYHRLRLVSGATEAAMELVLALRASQQGVPWPGMPACTHLWRSTLRHAAMHVCYINDLASAPEEIENDDNNALVVRLRCHPEFQQRVQELLMKRNNNTSPRANIVARARAGFDTLAGPLGVAMVHEIMAKTARQLAAVQAGVATIRQTAGPRGPELLEDATLDWMVGNVAFSLRTNRYTRGVPLLLAAMQGDSASVAAAASQVFLKQKDVDQQQESVSEESSLD